MRPHGGNNPNQVYMASLVDSDEIEIRTVAVPVSRARLRFDYQAVQAATNTLVAEGYTVHAAIGATGRPVRLPDRVWDLLG